MIKGRAQSLLTLAGAVGTAWMLGCMNPTDSSQNNATLAMSQSGSADSSDHGGGVGKTTLCHIPPGNPANAHTITVGNPAVKAHLAHGDYLGTCKAETTPAISVDCGSGNGNGHSGGNSGHDTSHEGGSTGGTGGSTGTDTSSTVGGLHF